MTPCTLRVTVVEVPTEPTCKVYQVEIEGGGAAWCEVAKTDEQLQAFLRGCEVALKMVGGAGLMIGTETSVDHYLKPTEDSVFQEWLQIHSL